MTKSNTKYTSPEGMARVLIDKKLENSGWAILRKGNSVPIKGNFAIEEIQTDDGTMDYGLFIDGVLLGDVESKATETGIPSVLSKMKDILRNTVLETLILADIIFHFFIPQMVILYGLRMQGQRIVFRRRLQNFIHLQL